MPTTYLYVKRHAVTGLKYFGKTIKADPYKYPGSGLVWRRHLQTHGKEHVVTDAVYSFDDIEKCKDFAIRFSRKNNIVESTEWANLVEENGCDGFPYGWKQSPEHIEKRVRANRGRRFTEEHKAKLRGPKTASHKEKLRMAKLGTKQSKETRLKRAKSRKGYKHSPETIEKLRQSALARKITPPWINSRNYYSPIQAIECIEGDHHKR